MLYSILRRNITPDERRNGATLLTATIMSNSEYQSKYELFIIKENYEPRVWLADNWQSLYKVINDCINYAKRNPPKTEITYTVFRTKDAKKIREISIYQNITIDLLENEKLRAKPVIHNYPPDEIDETDLPI